MVFSPGLALIDGDAEYIRRPCDVYDGTSAMNISHVNVGSATQQIKVVE
jgi:hypothetical protein